MKHALIAIGLAVLSLSASAGRCTRHDAWSNDILKNVGLSAVAGGAITAASGNPLVGVGSVAALALAKEAADTRSSMQVHHCSLQDFVQAVVGAAIGSYGMNLFIAPARGGVVVGYSKEF